MFRNAVVAVSLLFLMGCSSQSGDASETEQPTLDSPTPAPQSESSPVEPNPAEILQLCSDEQRSGAQATVTSQTSALRDGDFELAYSYASPGFRSGVSLEQFSALILASYQPLLAQATLEFGECLVDSGGSQLAMDVVLRGSGENSLGLRYILGYTEGGWLVDGASNFAVGGRAA